MRILHEFDLVFMLVFRLDYRRICSRGFRLLLNLSVVLTLLFRLISRLILLPILRLVSPLFFLMRFLPIIHLLLRLIRQNATDFAVYFLLVLSIDFPKIRRSLDYFLKSICSYLSKFSVSSVCKTAKYACS